MPICAQEGGAVRGLREAAGVGGGRHRVPEGRNVLTRDAVPAVVPAQQLGPGGGCGPASRCRVPDEAGHRPKWQLAPDMLDELAAVGLRPAVLVADTGYGANADFRHVPRKTAVWPTHGRSRAK